MGPGPANPAPGTRTNREFGKGEQLMPVYKAQDMQATPDIKNPNMKMIQFGGELIKVGIVTYKTGEGPPSSEKSYYQGTGSQFSAPSAGVRRFAGVRLPRGRLDGMFPFVLCFVRRVDQPADPAEFR